MVSGNVTSFREVSLMDEDSTITAILGARRSERKPPVFTPRSRSLEDLPGGIRVPIVKRAEPRLKTKLQATKAGLEELNFLRERHQQMVNEAKLTTSSKRSSDSPHGPDNKIGRGPMKAFRRYSTNSFRTLSGISEENTPQVTSRRASSDSVNTLGSRQPLSHTDASDIDAEISDVRSDVGSSRTTLSRSSESTDSSTSGGQISDSNSGSVTPVEEEISPAAGAYLRRRMLTKSNSISVIDTSRLDTHHEPLASRTAAATSNPPPTRTRRASAQCEAVLTGAQFNTRGVAESSHSYNFPSPLHAVLRQYSSATKLDQANPSTATINQNNAKHDLSHGNRSAFERIDENSSLGPIAEEGRQLQALHAGLVRDSRPALKSLQRRHSFHMYRLRHGQPTHPNTHRDDTQIDTKQRTNSSSTVHGNKSVLSTHTARESCEHTQQTVEKHGQAVPKTVAIEPPDGPGGSEEVTLSSTVSGDNCDKHFTKIAEKQNSSSETEDKVSRQEVTHTVSVMKPPQTSEAAVRESGSLISESAKVSSAKLHNLSSSSDDDVFEESSAAIKAAPVCVNQGNSGALADNTDSEKDKTKRCSLTPVETHSVPFLQDKREKDTSMLVPSEICTGNPRQKPSSQMSTPSAKVSVVQSGQDGHKKTPTDSGPPVSLMLTERQSKTSFPNANKVSPPSFSDVRSTARADQTVSSSRAPEVKGIHNITDGNSRLIQSRENTKDFQRRSNNLSVDEGYSPSIISSKYSLVSDEGYGASIPSSKCSFASDESFPVFSPSRRRQGRKLSIQSNLTWISTDMDDTFSSVDCFHFSPTGNRETDCYPIPSPTEAKPNASITESVAEERESGQISNRKVRNVKPLLETAL